MGRNRNTCTQAANGAQNVFLALGLVHHRSSVRAERGAVGHASCAEGSQGHAERDTDRPKRCVKNLVLHKKRARGM